MVIDKIYKFWVINSCVKTFKNIIYEESINTKMCKLYSELKIVVQM